MSKIEKIDDRSAAIKIEYEEIEAQLMVTMSKLRIESLLQKKVALISEIDWLLEDANEALATLLDVSDKTDDEALGESSNSEAEDNDVSNDDKEDNTVVRSRTWLFIAGISAVIVWLIWRNHDFSEATLFQGQPLLIKHSNADSEWAAILAGFAAFAGIFFINEVYYAFKGKLLSVKDSKHKKSS
jgi:hypothetical protein